VSYVYTPPRFSLCKFHAKQKQKNPTPRRKSLRHNGLRRRITAKNVPKKYLEKIPKKILDTLDTKNRYCIMRGERKDTMNNTKDVKYNVRVLVANDKYRRIKSFVTYLPANCQNIPHAIVDRIREHGFRGKLQFLYDEVKK
jgi:hypothetical protein